MSGLENAKGWFSTIVEMVDALRASEEEAREEAETRIHESVLSVEVRSDWIEAGALASIPVEYRILLTTGGPALRLIGALSERGEPESARLEWQDWGTPWTAVNLWDCLAASDPNIRNTPGNEAFEKADAYLLDFARQFYFGDGA